MESVVYFADMRAGHKENLFEKLGRLMLRSGCRENNRKGRPCCGKGAFRRTGQSCIRAPGVRSAYRRGNKECGGKPFLTDSSTLYPGERKEGVSALVNAIENGFAFAVVGAPLIMSDGLRGHTATDVEIDGEILQKVSIGTEIVEADVLLAVSHFKCHELTGFGGVLKNLGMGCSSGPGSLSSTPRWRLWWRKSSARHVRSASSPASTMQSRSSKAKRRSIPARCAGCGRCITVARKKAINIQWNEASSLVMKKMCEHALGAIKGKRQRSLYLNFITQVSPACDCYGHADAPIVNDIGICASTDPVALDQACADLVNNAVGNRDTALESGFEPGGDKFRGVYPDIEWEVQLEYGEQIGLGTRKYELVKI